MVCSPSSIPIPLEPEVPCTLPETEFLNPESRKATPWIHPSPNPCCFPETWCSMYFALMNSASLTGSCRCLSQLPQDSLESESMWLQQGKNDSVTASHRDLLADCPRDLGCALGWLSVWLIKQSEAFQENQVPSLISLSFLPFVIAWELHFKGCLTLFHFPHLPSMWR